VQCKSLRQHFGQTHHEGKNHVASNGEVTPTTKSVLLLLQETGITHQQRQRCGFSDWARSFCLILSFSGSKTYCLFQACEWRRQRGKAREKRYTPAMALAVPSDMA
jgi:hypothetical protein